MCVSIQITDVPFNMGTKTLECWVSLAQESLCASLPNSEFCDFVLVMGSQPRWEPYMRKWANATDQGFLPASAECITGSPDHFLTPIIPLIPSSGRHTVISHLASTVCEVVLENSGMIQSVLSTLSIN